MIYIINILIRPLSEPSHPVDGDGIILDKTKVINQKNFVLICNDYSF